MEIAGSRPLLPISAALVVFSIGGNCFHFPGVPLSDFQKDPLVVKVKKLTSTKTQLPYSYYSLPYCRPNTILESAENLGEVPLGDRVEHSPYVFEMREPHVCNIVCKLTLNDEEAKGLKEKIEDEYRVNMILDNLPLAVPFKRLDQNFPTIYQDGFYVGIKGQSNGGKDEKYFIHNHLSFLVKYHKDEQLNVARIVGFQVKAFSVQHEYESEWKGNSTRLSTCDPHGKSTVLNFNSPQEVQANKDIVFTYDVEFKESDMNCASRWDSFLLRADDQIHWFSIMNFMIIVLFLSGMVAMNMLQAFKRDISKYNRLETQEEAVEETGRKLVDGDVFRPPADSDLLFVNAGAKAMWDSLPAGLVYEISKRLSTLSDYLRFCATCHAWRFAAVPGNFHPWLPWLFPSAPGEGVCRFFSPFENRFYHVDLPETRGKSCRGSSHGWLFFVGDTPDVFLLNPLTRARIQLPPLTTLPHVLGFRPCQTTGHEYCLCWPLSNSVYTLDSETVCNFYITKAVLSSNPATEPDCLVMILCGYRAKVAICRIGSDSWIEADAYPSVSSVSDIAFYKGTFYVIGCMGRIAMCDISTTSLDLKLLSTLEVPILETGKHLLQDDGPFLVESEGVLLAVVRCQNEDPLYIAVHGFANYTKNFFVYLLIDEELRGVEIDTIRDATLFVSRISACASVNLPGCRADSIYFTDAYLDENDGGHGVCVFHLEDKSIERFPFDIRKFHHDLPPPIWFTPSLG